MATNFLWLPGSSNTGLLGTAVTLFHGTAASDEFYGLTTGTVRTSGTSGATGVFDNSNFSQGIWAELFLTLGAIGSALAAGATVSGWFLKSYDGGTNYENPGSGVAPARAADFYINLPATTITSGNTYNANGLILIPALKFKTCIQNGTGQTFSADSVNYLRAAPVAMQAV